MSTPSAGLLLRHAPMTFVVSLPAKSGHLCSITVILLTFCLSPCESIWDNLTQVTCAGMVILQCNMVLLFFISLCIYMSLASKRSLLNAIFLLLLYLAFYMSLLTTFHYFCFGLLENIHDQNRLCFTFNLFFFNSTLNYCDSVCTSVFIIFLTHQDPFQ